MEGLCFFSNPRGNAFHRSKSTDMRKKDVFMFSRKTKKTTVYTSFCKISLLFTTNSFHVCLDSRTDSLNTAELSTFT